jgi:hypothetical protein
MHACSQSGNLSRYDDPQLESRYGEEIFFFPPKCSGPIQPPIQLIPEFFSGNIAARAWRWPLISILCWGENDWSWTSSSTLGATTLYECWPAQQQQPLLNPQPSYCKSVSSYLSHPLLHHPPSLNLSLPVFLLQLVFTLLLFSPSSPYALVHTPSVSYFLCFYTSKWNCKFD